MGSVLDAVKDYFARDEWPYNEDENGLWAAYPGQNGTFDCLAIPDDEASRFVFYALLPFEIPPEARGAVMEFVTRANNGMVVGNFETDLDDGIARFKTSIDAREATLTYELVRNAAITACFTMDEYLPGFKGVLEGMEPEEAVARIEAAADEEPPPEEA